MWKELDEKFHLSGNIISRLPNLVEISHNWLLKVFNHKETAFCARLFGESEEDNFEVPPYCTKVGLIIEPLPGATKLYYL